MNTPTNDLAALLAETPSAPPCGDDLSYDADFLALESAAQNKPEQQFGHTVIASQPPDWRDVENKALALLARTKDLRVASLLCRAWTSLQGMVGAADGLELIASMTERYWPALHPLPEDGDSFMRLNALAFLDDQTGFLQQLRQTALVRTAVGQVLVRDAEALAKGLSLSAACTLSGDQIRIGIAQAWAQAEPALGAVSRLTQAMNRIGGACALQLGDNHRPATAALQSLLHSLSAVLPDAAKATEAHNSPLAVTAPGQTPLAPGQPVVQAPGQLRSREDAVAQLQRVVDFLEHTEPTNPAPLLIRRAVRLMQMGFIDILRELSPESLAQIENITGSRSES